MSLENFINPQSHLPRVVPESLFCEPTFSDEVYISSTPILSLPVPTGKKLWIIPVFSTFSTPKIWCFFLKYNLFTIRVRLSDVENFSLMTIRRNFITITTFPLKTAHFLAWSVFNIDDRFEIYFPHECRTCETYWTKTRIAFKRRTSNSKWIRKSWKFK